MGSIYKRAGSKHYWLRYRNAQGKLVRRSSGTTSKAKAEERLAELEAKALAQAGAKAARFAGRSTREPEQDLDRRLAELESVVRRLVTYQAFQGRMFASWSEIARRFLPKGRFRDELEDEVDG